MSYTTYADRFTSFENRKKQAEKHLRILTIARGICFLSAIASVFFWETVWIPASGALMFVLFFIFLKKSNETRNEIQEAEVGLRINQLETDALSNNFSQFHDGAEFQNHAHAFTSDMDIFGKSSLFQYLNRTVTVGGKLRLADYLQTTVRERSEILNKQNAVRDLAERLNFRQKFAIHGTAYAQKDFFKNEYSKTEDDLHRAFSVWTSEKTELTLSKFWKVAAFAFPAFTFSVLILCIFGFLPYSLLAFFGTLNLTIIGLKLRYINAQHAKLESKAQTLSVVRRLAQCVAEEQFKSDYLQTLKSNLISEHQNALVHLKKLETLLKRFDYRLNLVVGFMLNMLLMWDLHVVLALEQFKKQNHSFFDTFFETLSEIDALSSLANFSFNNPKLCFPEISQDNFILNIEEAGHPLIPESKRVTNNFTIEGLQKIGIVTGANMAGKSTFLRTVGVNMILASAGSVVCAKNMQFTPIELFTSIRSQDSLSENASYFYSELMRLKLIVDKLKRNERLFVIIDEMLRGTNSKDKHEGSRGLILQLIRYQTSGLVATHDVQLGELAQRFPGNIFNKRFESEIIDGQLVFDYTMKNGVSEHLNASYLMQKYGIIE